LKNRGESRRLRELLLMKLKKRKELEPRGMTISPEARELSLLVASLIKRDSQDTNRLRRKMNQDKNQSP